MSHQHFARAEREKANVALCNLVSDGLKFRPEQGLVQFGAREHDLHMEINIKDDRAGISQATLGKLENNPFYSTQ
ncbi:ATP-binding protein [Flavihumibacter stibioxidans]|uniref:Uncharacterized protein n=1 Tax=Flavihumibacter stibioxidans TaxID=1834163 RepID=A0ABR7M429_9BACT|nr:hypothetical protein [Flavihumibacter stibioxidans]